MAAELAYLEFGELIDKLVEEGKFTSEESTTLARLGLANYFAAATVLPYRQFHDVAENFRYDVERLSAFYSVSYETIAHRLSTLQRPSMRGVPFSFIRVDRAGNMSKRQSATGFHFSSSGGTCPLWNVYETFANPGKIGVQIAQMPDGRNYMWVARTVERRAPRYGQPGKTFAIGLGCELRHAHRLVYSEGLDLSGDNLDADRCGLPGLRARQLPAAGLPRARPRAGHQRAPQHRVAVSGEAAPVQRRRSWGAAGCDRLAPVSAIETVPRASRPADSRNSDRSTGPSPRSAPGRSGRRRFTCSMCSASTGFCSWRGCRSRDAARMLASFRSRTPRLVILRVGHLRNCEYELQQHRRLATQPGHRRRRPGQDLRGTRRRGATERQRALITATDEFVVTRSVSPETWAALAGHADQTTAHRILHAGRPIRRAGGHHRDVEVPLDFPD